MNRIILLVLLIGCQGIWAEGPEQNSDPAQNPTRQPQSLSKQMPTYDFTNDPRDDLSEDPSGSSATEGHHDSKSE